MKSDADGDSSHCDPLKQMNFLQAVLIHIPILDAFLIDLLTAGRKAPSKACQ